MNSILFLENSDFRLASSDQGNILFCTGCPNGFSLVLFYLPSCKHCVERALPDFRVLPRILNGCQFGMVNVAAHPQLVQLSMKTISIIDRVPTFIFFVNGIPYKKVYGPHPIDDLKNFVMSTVATLQPQQFTTKNIETVYNKQRKRKEIAPWSTGIAKESETTELYSEYDDAYDDVNMKGNWRDNH